VGSEAFRPIGRRGTRGKGVRTALAVLYTKLRIREFSLSGRRERRRRRKPEEPIKENLEIGRNAMVERTPPSRNEN